MLSQVFTKYFYNHFAYKMYITQSIRQMQFMLRLSVNAVDRMECTYVM